MIAPVLAGLTFAASIALILSGRVHRTIVVMVGAVIMMAIGLAAGFYTEEDAIRSIDFTTLGLLVGMMILMRLLEPTGVFEYLALRAGQLSRGDPWRLMVLLSVGTSIVSLFLSNVTTVILVAPITILLAELMGMSPVPFLMAEALLSDTAGVATSVGDPASVLIATGANLTFVDFLTHSLPIVAVASVAALVAMRFLFRHELSAQAVNAEAMLKLNPDEALKDTHTARQVLIVLGLAVAFFFLQDPLNISPAFIALAASAVALAWVQPDLHAVFEGVEWDVLLFLTGLFVMVGGLEKAGVLEVAADAVGLLSNAHPAVLGIVIIWMVAALSALVANIPVTVVLIPVIGGLSRAGVDISPLWWALAFGAGFGGNATMMGSSANVVIVSLSERTRTPLTPLLWTRRGLPIMIVTCTVASILYALLYRWLGR
jgi:Na+/H+ antiporter NhaD/arsenite permease-like protein